MILLLLAVVVLGFNSVMTQQYLRQQTAALEWRPGVESGHVAGWNFLTSESGAELAVDDNHSSPTPQLQFDGFRPMGLRFRVGQTIDINGGLIGIPYITDVPVASLTIEESPERIEIRHDADIGQNHRTRSVVVVAGWPEGLLEALQVTPVDHKGITIRSSVVQMLANGRIALIEVPNRRPGEINFLWIRTHAIDDSTSGTILESAGIEDVSPQPESEQEE